MVEGKVRAGPGDQYPGTREQHTRPVWVLPGVLTTEWSLGILPASFVHKGSASVPASLLCPRRAPLRETEGLDASGPRAFWFRAAARVVSQ